jgi:hypothetical protein
MDSKMVAVWSNELRTAPLNELTTGSKAQNKAFFILLLSKHLTLGEFLASPANNSSLIINSLSSRKNAAEESVYYHAKDKKDV